MKQDPDTVRFAATPLILVLLIGSADAQPTANNAPWYERVKVGLEVGPTGAQFGNSDPDDVRYAARFDGDEIVRQSVAANSDYLVIWARDGDYAYYDSELLPKAPGLRGRDPLRDAVRAARKQDLPLVAYCVVQQAGHFLNAHPEWEMRGVDGKPLGRFCYNSGYLEAMKTIVAEQMEYGIDGFHIDMLDQGFGPPYGCWCETCQSLFQDRYGHQMPAGATWDRDWEKMLEFRYWTSERFEKELAGFIKSSDPRVTVDYNYHGNPPFSFEVGQRPVQHANNADFVTGETGVWGFSALGVGLNAAFYRATTPGIPFQVAMQRGVRMYHDQTTRPLNDIRWELLTLLAHGAFVTIVDKTAFDGSLDPVAYERFREAFAEVQRKRQHFGQSPVPDVGIYFSSRSRDWCGRDNASRYFQSFQGAHRACVLEHLQFGVVLDENVDLDTLKRYPIVCLANTAIVSDDEVHLLRRYVEQGGRLLITGQSGLSDRFGNPRTDSVLANLVGARVKRLLETHDNWIQFGVGQNAEETPQNADDATAALTVLSAGIRTDWPFLVEGPAVAYEPTSAVPIGALIPPHRTARQLQGRLQTDWPMSPDVEAEPVGPAFLLHRIGKGMVLTCAASPDFATVSEHPVVAARKVFRNAVALLYPEPPVDIDAPANVEAIVTRDGPSGPMRVHLIAYNSTPQATPPRNRPYVIPGLVEEAPMYRVRMTLRDTPVDVQAWNPSTRVQQQGRTIEAVVEDIHEVILIEAARDRAVRHGVESR